MASSAGNQQEYPPNMYATTAAPPPTPSTQPKHHLASSAATADALSRLLLRLPPALSLPTNRSPSTRSPPVISLLDPKLNDLILSSASQLGFFQLINHDIPPQLAGSAESESLSLFDLTLYQKESIFPKNWPLGFDADDELDAGNRTGGQSFCLGVSCLTESKELALSSLLEFTRVLEKLGLRIIDTLARAVGFENPVGEDPTGVCSLMWISEGQDNNDEPVMLGGFYPYVVGLQYQIRCQKCKLLTDSGWVSASPQVDSIMVTLGDIAQVWSNGKLKKVRGRPVACLGEESKSSRCISMSLQVTLRKNCRISPLLPKENGKEEENDDQIHGNTQKKVFNSFPLEDYAWRGYQQRLPLKDPLDRYRI